MRALQRRTYAGEHHKPAGAAEDGGRYNAEPTRGIAVRWRSEKIVELVTVEVSLDFTSRLVQQERNYTRFSDRVWLAAPVLADAADVSQALRE